MPESHSCQFLRSARQKEPGLAQCLALKPSGPGSRRRSDAFSVGPRGPARTSVGAMLNRYAHQFTLLKGGCDAELTRISHYLVGAGMPALRREAVDGRQQLSPVSGPIGGSTPKGWVRHLEHRRSRRSRTYDLIHALGGTVCARVTTSTLRELATTMRAEGLSESTVQKELALLKAAFNVAIREWGWAGYVNPAIGISLGRSRRRFVRLTEEEEHRLVRALSECDNPQFWPLVELALTSTMRRGSLLKLEWSNIDLQAREAHVWAKGAEVTLPLSRRAITLLRHLPDNGTGRVFSMSENAVKMAWEGVREKAGLPRLRFADLRHLGATFYARAGLNAHQLQKVLGHASTRMAEVYVNLVNSDVTEALDLAESTRPLTRPMPPTVVNETQRCDDIVAQRRTRRLNGDPVLPANVIRFPKGTRSADEADRGS